MKSPIIINQFIKRESPLAIVPIGLFLNKKIQNARPGDIVEMHQSWRREKYILIRRARLNVNSPVFTLLFKHIAGVEANWAELVELWNATCIVGGLGKNAFSDKEVMLLELKPYIKEEYEAEMERIRQAEEKERISQEIQAGTYRHKDIIY